MFYPFTKVQKNHSLFGSILDLPPGDKGNSEHAATE